MPNFKPMRCDTLWHNAQLITLNDANGGLGEINDGALACRDGQIIYAGPASGLPPDAAISRVDCAGGGIMSTVRPTRADDEQELIAASLPRLDVMLAEGITTIEIESGYGLSLEHETKPLKVAAQLGQQRKVEIMPALLGAHAVPPGSDAQAYLDEVCNQLIPAVAAQGLAEAVDVFCEDIAFSNAQAEQVFDTAKAHGLELKIHAEQRSNQHGAALAARQGALSADHIEPLDAGGAAAGRVLFHPRHAAATHPASAPGRCGHGFGQRQQPGDFATGQSAAGHEHGCHPVRHDRGRLHRRLHLEAARALGRRDRLGQLRVGFDCELALRDIETLADLVCRSGFNPLHGRVWRGQDAYLMPAPVLFLRTSSKMLGVHP